MQGKVFMSMGGMQAPEGQPPRFNQIYVYDPAEGAEQHSDIRLAHMALPATVPQNKKNRIKELLDYLHDRLLVCNRYVRDFKTVYAMAHEAAEADDPANAVTRANFRINADARPAGEHERRYNEATGCKEVQVLIPDGAADAGVARDVLQGPRPDLQGRGRRPVHQVGVRSWPALRHRLQSWRPGVHQVLDARQSPDAQRGLY